MRDSLALGFAEVGPPEIWPEFTSDSDWLDGLGEGNLSISGALWRRGRLNVDFFFGATSRLSVGAVVMMDGAVPFISTEGSFGKQLPIQGLTCWHWGSSCSCVLLRCLRYLWV